MLSHMNVAVFVALFRAATADLPVHCLKHQVEGDWDFFLTPGATTRSSCGHKHPDIESGQPPRQMMSQLAGGKPLKTQRVSLMNPNVVKSEKHSGTWTMVYDEGFEVNVNGMNFFAFSNFTFESADKHNVSHCGDTMIGWYHNAERTMFGCYYGVKVEKQAAVPVPTANTNSTHTKDHVKLDKKKMEKKVAKINMLQLGWKARVMPKWIGKTMQEINSYAGLRRTTPMRDLHRDMMSQRAASKRRPSFLEMGRRAKLPEAFDWSDASGVDWLEPVMDQADCGSCYAASTMRMLSVRHKIKQNDTNALPWSINMPLHCGEYNQGCKGGYGSLIAKWGEDVGLVPATCMRYNTQGTCKLECDLDKLEGKRYRTANHRLIGGFYGNSTTRAMMEEIYYNGPIVVSFEPADDFMFYSDGVYKSPKSKQAAALAESRFEQPWEKVDHAVLAVGWGVEDGVKYWRIQNSWGEDWGEDGFFRMLRDEDESGVESMPEAADVVEDEQKGRRVAEFFKELEKKPINLVTL